MIDLNSDVGEGFGPHPGGPDAELMPLLTSANVACGGHAGDPTTMRRTCELAARHRVVIGAHVSYPDLVGFGRRFVDMAPAELTDTLLAQIAALDALARPSGGVVRYLKPHGALYNAVVRHEQQAAAVVRAVLEWGAMPILGLPGSVIADECHRRGVQFVAEGFADRGYRPDGTLVPRSEPGALIVDPQEAARQAVDLAARGVASICVHSDTPGAVAVATAVNTALLDRGHELESFALRHP
ncbi:MAG: 5-oxoprolinase subunit PxpA [Ilumatobacteraceae bacterium]